MKISPRQLSIQFILLSVFVFAKASAVDNQTVDNQTVNTQSVNAQKLNESKTDLNQVTEEKTKSPWSVSFFSIGGLTPAQIDKGSGSYSAYNYLSLNYKINKDSKFAIRPVFYLNTSGYDKYNAYQEQSAKLGDLILMYALYNYVDQGPLKISTQFKLYLPTSEQSKINRQIAQFRPETYVELTVIGTDTLTWVIKPDIYLQSQTAYLDSTTPIYDDGTYRFDPRKTTRIAYLEHYLEYAKDLGRDFTFKPALGFKEEWTNGSNVENLSPGHNTVVRSAIGVDIKLVRGWTFTPGVENISKSSNPEHGVMDFVPKDNNYFLMINGSLN